MQSMVISKKQWFLIGVTTGVMISMIVMPLIEDCHHWDQSANDYNSSKWYSFISKNDFNPVIRLNHNRSQTDFDTKHINQRVFRPKYFSTELGVKENLLICVHLSKNNGFNWDSFLLNKTVEEFSDKVMYFYEDSPFSSGPKHTVNDAIVLNIESNEVPFMTSKPKYLKILKYLFNTRIVQNFNFIFIISDKTFVNRNNLNQFLNNHSVSQHIFASPLISFNSNFNNNYNNYNNNELNSSPNVLLESGVILSSSLLLKCNLDLNCLNQMRNTFPNPNQKTFTSYRLNSNSQDLDQNNIDFKSIYESLTVFPVLHINTYYKLNLILCQKSINDTIRRLESIENKIITSNANESVVEWPIGVEPPLRASNRFEVIRWTYFNESHSLMPNDFDVSLPLNRIESIELSHIKYECIQWLQNTYSELTEEQNIEVINFYRRFDAIRGLEYIIDFRLKPFKNIKRLQVIKPFNKIEVIPGVPYVTESVRVILILTIKSSLEVENTLSFLSQYTNICLKKSSHRTVLILVLIYKPNYGSDEYMSIKSEATKLQIKYKNSGAKIAWIPIVSAKDNRVPTEVAYFDIITKKLSLTFSDALLLHCRPNQIPSLDYLNRVRLNTIQSNQVFFPIPFVEYRLRSQVKTSKTFDVRKDSGYFETTNYNLFSFYLSDYLKVRKTTQQVLTPVRNEEYLKQDIYYESDVDIYNLFLEYNKNCDKNTVLSKKLFIMRAIEPELRLKYLTFGHNCVETEGNRPALQNCQQRSVLGLGTRPQLAALVIDSHQKDRQDRTDDQNVDF